MHICGVCMCLELGKQWNELLIFISFGAFCCCFVILRVGQLVCSLHNPRNLLLWGGKKPVK